VRALKQNKLNITFHNPNTPEETVAVLIKIAAEVAKAKVVSAIHNQPNENRMEEPSAATG